MATKAQVVRIKSRMTIGTKLVVVANTYRSDMDGTVWSVKSVHDDKHKIESEDSEQFPGGIVANVKWPKKLRDVELLDNDSFRYAALVDGKTEWVTLRFLGE